MRHKKLSRLLGHLARVCVLVALGVAVVHVGA